MPKKLALIPALALAIAGLGATPALADTAAADSAYSAAGAAAENLETAVATDDAAPADDAATTDDPAPAEPAPAEDPTPSEGSSSGDDAPAEDPTPSEGSSSGDDAPATGTPDAPSPAEDETPAADESTDGAEEETAPASAPIEATVTVDPSTVDIFDFWEDGVTITVSGLEKDDVVTNSLTGETKTAKGSTVEFEYFDDAEEIVEAQVVDFTVTVERADQEPQEFPGRFTITEEDYEDFQEGELSLATNSMSVSEFKRKGIAFTGTGFAPGEIAFAAAAKFDAENFYVDQLIYSEDDLTVSDEGVVSGVIRPTETDDIKPGDYIAIASGEEQFSSAEFTLTADQAQASLTVSPKTIDASDFANKDKGVTLTVSDCTPGSDVRFVVTPKGNSDVTAFDQTLTADETGTASVNVFGTSSRTQAYVGDYSVTATCGDDTLTGEFSVTSGANAGGTTGTGNDSGSQLPRTGADFGGLTGGLALLLVGGVAVAMTMRRAKAGQAPTEL
ncbi:hypothetical protein M3G43_05060 [Brevibacterium casei]|uniref:hypothetical protein n=1 Tax=Brevibacterium casei TaxID=33889 RepID=UPI00223AE014|nr:hypothetical protein [Brevibacterium casei]MCT1446626.1 hypothetical protein [Brevibacterium casei]